MTRLPRKQRTLANTAHLSGFGYWTGADVTVEFRPAPVDTGYVFIRCDLMPVRRIEVTPDNRVVTPRRTTLTKSGGTVEMVEHLLAALCGMQIDNCEIVVSAPEMPAFDGSCKEAVAAIDAAGTVDQASTREQLTVTDTVRVGDDDCWIEARPQSDSDSDANDMTIRYELDYGDGPIGSQTFSTTVNPTNFRKEIAPARTFLLEQEAAKLQEQGISNRATFNDLLVFGPNGPIKNTLRFADECARHKALDIVGDLALIGIDLNAEIIAHRSGHKQNTELAASLLSRYKSVRQKRLSA